MCGRIHGDVLRAGCAAVRQFPMQLPWILSGRERCQPLLLRPRFPWKCMPIPVQRVPHPREQVMNHSPYLVNNQTLKINRYFTYQIQATK